MEVGADVWIKDTVGVKAWVSGVISSKVQASDQAVIVLTVTDTETGLESIYRLENENDEPDLVKLKNAEDDAAVDNLISLPYLHEPAILYCLEQRYYRSDIYTYTGPILIAVNPFKKVNLYGSHVLELYYNHGLLKSQGIENTTTALPPHVYAVADAAYRDMMRVILHGYHQHQQVSILKPS
jgi:myosin heavy subunit